jgi:predicted dehydrogenase
VKILVAGLGAAGQRHCRNIRAILGEEADLLAFRSRGTSPVLDERLGTITGADPADTLRLRTFTNLEEAFGERPDAVVVSTPSSLHLAVARAAVEADCAVFLEKPLSHSWEGVPEFIASIERKKLTSFVGYQWRFHPIMEWLKSFLESRPFGPFIAVRVEYGEYLPDWHPYEDYRKSYAANRRLGGGVLLTQIHDFDYIGWLLGWPHVAYSVGGHISGLEIDVEDVASTLMKCTVDGRDIPVHIHQDYLQRPPVRSCEFIAEEGRICVDLSRATVHALDAAGRSSREEEFSSFSRNEMFLAEMRHFIACVDSRQQSLIPAREGARSLAVALAALRSQGSGKPETVVYP